MRRVSKIRQKKIRFCRQKLPKVGFVSVGQTKIRHGISKLETTILTYFPNVEKSRVIHAFGKVYVVDGYDRAKNEIIEILGSYFHGDLRKYKPNEFNSLCKKTMLQLYNETKARFQLFKSMGFSVRFIWEEDWKKYKSMGRLYKGIEDNLF